ncbi:MAG: ABC transporter ATP-binding protein [Candidatus Devosia phytovorans]|uniref:ABC transporter ATP-binding protein n=1 Tax=Candidatus Devosia phytovorans TaxID=3121372 RepID=A0AAJ5VYA0_9HYPH|nr:ABC transporter ATP-binding protein [Devosia sp.]WEK06226.1 MAG: ABC transporter ATP-binding protein [Devosia sp.]
MSALIDVKGLTVHAGDTILVSDLSFSLSKGERLGLIGESGSGKSLTALASTGLLPTGLSAEGSVTLAGQAVIGASDSDLNRLRGTAVAIVFQEPLTALDPLMRVGKQVAEPLARRARRDGEPLTGAALDKAVLALLDDVALPDPARLSRAYPHELSGGQRQRIAIAMALACKPDLLIADEPTTALDVTTQAEILGLLDRLVRERDMALLFISHDLPVVANTVQRVVVLRQGVAVEAGPVADVFANPKHDYTRSLLAAALRLDTALEGTS